LRTVPRKRQLQPDQREYNLHLVPPDGLQQHQ
jgi:hypothetical protein